MKKLQKGRGLLYLRDSGGRHEMTPAQYVEWAQGQAKSFGVSFDGTAEQIHRMIRESSSIGGDLFLDYGVSGNILSREGLNALIARAVTDPQVTHVFIPRRDRLARPDDPLDGIQLEKTLRQSGITLVFIDRTLAPLKLGTRQDLAELLTALVDYDRSAKDRRDLAQKILFAQIHLAKRGFSTGGRAPFGFRRWLVKEDGTSVRQLSDGERVRMPGHHVVWLPSAEEELKIVTRILDMVERMPASRVAAILTAEGVPSPDAGRVRKDGGRRHEVSGVWHQNTVANVARNPLLVAIISYGTRSMGDQLRFSPHGPRELGEDDFRTIPRSQKIKPKVIHNASADRIVAQATFEPVVDRERHQKLVALLDVRGKTQRGKPRSRDWQRNPLGSRIFDLNCSWPLYREPYLDGFRYRCGLYQQSHGQQCANNHVDGPGAVRFVLACLRQRLLSSTLLPKLERKLREFAAQDKVLDRSAEELRAKREAMAQFRVQLDRVGTNMALAEDQRHYKVIAAKFDELTALIEKLESEIAVTESQQASAMDMEAEVQAALELGRRLTELAADDRRLESATELFELTNARLFLRFHGVQLKKRWVNRVDCGVVTFGAAASPVPLYDGPTARRKIKGPAADANGPVGCCSTVPPNGVVSGEEVESLGNTSRGDWI